MIDYLFCAGGTGGHVFPAISTAAYLQQQGYTVGLITDQRGVRYLDRYPVAWDNTLIYDIVRQNRLQYMWDLAKAFVKSWFFLRKYRPKVVIGFGGYPSLPGLLAAQLLGIPTIIHEQNALLGAANRLLARRAKKIALSFERTARVPDGLDQERCIVTGNPILPDIIKIAQEAAYVLPDQEHPIKIVIIGGSQGSALFAKLIPSILVPFGRQIEVYHQCPQDYIQSVTNVYQSAGINARVVSFFHDMPAVLLQAHLVIARAGATTIAELQCLQRPAILIPLAISAEGDQAHNAQALAQAGAAVVLTEGAHLQDQLTDLMRQVFMDHSILMGMHYGYNNLSPITMAHQRFAQCILDTK